MRTATASNRTPITGSANPLTQFGRQIPLPIPVPDWSKPIIVGLLLLALWFWTRARLAAVRATRLERQRSVLLRDLDAMQVALVPEVPDRLEGLSLSVAYRPAEGPAAGGDFYDVFSPAPGKVAIMLGDVAGHGHQALTQAALTRYTLRAYMQTGLEPRRALALAGRVLGAPRGERFATVAVALYDGERGELTYALAGHPPPIFLGLPARKPLTACSSPPIGWGVPTGRRQTTVSLPAGSEVCFFSDGLIEARSDRDGNLLGRERLGAILSALGSHPEAGVLLGKVRAAAHEAPDDMVACILSPQTSPGGAPTYVEELEATAATLRTTAVKRFLAECRVPEHEIQRTLRRARQLTASGDRVLLRVELDDGRPNLSAVPSATAAPAVTGGAHPSADRPLLEALAAG